MILQPSQPISPGQPIHSFLMSITGIYEQLGPDTQARIATTYEELIQEIGAMHRAHCEQPTLREGEWYLRQTLKQAQQAMTTTAVRAHEAALKLSEIMTQIDPPDPMSRELADFATSFCESVARTPRILSRTTPQPDPPQL